MMYANSDPNLIIRQPSLPARKQLEFGFYFLLVSNEGSWKADFRLIQTPWRQQDLFLNCLFCQSPRYNCNSWEDLFWFPYKHLIWQLTKRSITRTLFRFSLNILTQKHAFPPRQLLATQAPVSHLAHIAHICFVVYHSIIHSLLTALTFPPQSKAGNIKTWKSHRFQIRAGNTSFAQWKHTKILYILRSNYASSASLYRFAFNTAKGNARNKYEDDGAKRRVGTSSWYSLTSAWTSCAHKMDNRKK